MDYEIDVGVMFNTVQTGCQPMLNFVVPKGRESDTLGKVVSCKSVTPQGRPRPLSDLKWSEIPQLEPCSSCGLPDCRV